ncbi:MAG: hypothetical protein IJJ06_11405 [Mogibacterium sp.]|nr:hypothetical protein [Mogibacterium sp.]MBR0341323.1 hypothetical protein [Oscillospiraceae bacterium]
MSKSIIKRKVSGVLIIALIMLAGMLLFNQRVYADVEFDKWIEWSDVEDTIPTEQIQAGNPIAVTVSPEGEMWSYLFTPETTGPYLFYSDDAREDLDRMSPMGRVRAVDPATGEVEYIYEPEWNSGTNTNHFTIRFNAEQGRQYYIDTILKHPQSVAQTYEIKLEPDQYASIVYKPARRIEYLYNDDGTIDYGGDSVGFLHFTTFWISQGEFIYTKTDGTTEVYKYHFDRDAGSIGEFVCGNNYLDIGSNWKWLTDNTFDNPWGLGEHKVTVYVDGKPMELSVWLVKEYTYDRDYYPYTEEGGNPSGDKTDNNNTDNNNTSGSSLSTDTVSNDPIMVGRIVKLPQGSVKVISTEDKTVAFIKAQNKASVVVPATVKIEKASYKVTQVNANAFKGKKIRTVTIGKNVKTIKKNAFKGSKATKLVLKTKLLKKAKIKGCLKGSKIKIVQVKITSKASKTNKTYVKKYKKIFTKANAGKKVTVK